MADVNQSYHQDTRFRTSHSGITMGSAIGMGQRIAGDESGTTVYSDSTASIAPTAAQMVTGRYYIKCNFAGDPISLVVPAAADLWAAVISANNKPCKGMIIPWTYVQTNAAGNVVITGGTGTTVTGIDRVGAGIKVVPKFIVLTSPTTAEVL